MGIAYNTSVVRDGLVLHLDAANVKSYPGSGTTWYDLSGNSNNGTLVNGVGYSSDNKGILTFDKANDTVGIIDQIQFERTDSFTLAALFYSLDANNNQIINNENNSYRGYQFAIPISNQIYFNLRSTTSNRFQITTDSNTIDANKWYYAVVTYNGNSSASGANIYINGKIQNKNIVSDNLTGTTISGVTTYIGYRRPASNGPFNGNIAGVKIYNRELSAQEVRQNFESTRGRYGI